MRHFFSRFSDISFFRQFFQYYKLQELLTFYKIYIHIFNPELLENLSSTIVKLCLICVFFQILNNSIYNYYQINKYVKVLRSILSLNFRKWPVRHMMLVVGPFQFLFQYMYLSILGSRGLYCYQKQIRQSLKVGS